MTFEEFEKKFKRNQKKDRFDNYWNYGFCYLVISFGLYMLIKISGAFPAALFLIVLGICGLLILKNRYKLTIWENGLSKEQNSDLLKFVIGALNSSVDGHVEDYACFVYKRKRWTMPYEIHLFADNNRIALNADGKSSGGFIDFGASKRMQNKVLQLMKDQASRQ